MAQGLSRRDIERYLKLLGQRLLARGSRADILLAGGAAMVLLLNAREATKDIDAYFSGDVDALRTEVSAIANEFNLRPDWLNDGIKGFFFKAPPQTLWADYPGLRVYTVGLDYLLAMKVLALRNRQDEEDAKALVDRLGLTTAAEVMAIVTKYVPRELLTLRVQYAAEGLFD